MTLKEKKIIVEERIEINPEIMHGRPVIKGTRIPVDFIIGLLAKGLSPEEITKKFYPQLKREDILACLKYAYLLIKDEEIHVR